MKKSISELTQEEAKSILEFVYPNSDYVFLKLEFTPEKNKDGSIALTFNLEPVVGILYYNGQDRCVLHFYNSKVVLWLYQNNYDIEEYLTRNKYFSEMEQNFENFGFGVSMLSKGEEPFKKNDAHYFTLDYVKTRCKELLEKYLYCDYD